MRQQIVGVQVSTHHFKTEMNTAVYTLRNLEGFYLTSLSTTVPDGYYDQYPLPKARNKDFDMGI